MFHGQTSTGHCCSHISFQIYHDGSHCVEAPRTIFLHYRKGRERERECNNANRHFQMITILMWGFQEKETKTSTFCSQDNIFYISIIKTLQHCRKLWITLLCLLYFLKMCWFQLVLFPACSLFWLVCEPSWVTLHDKWTQPKQKTEFYIVWLCIMYGNSSNPTRNVGGFYWSLD